jgi:hypothetical protein
MTYTAPTVNYSNTIDGTFTSLTGVQYVSINRGRQRFQDNFQQTSCVVELIPANSYTLPLEIGQFIDVRDTNSGTSPCYFQGLITDITRNFNMPFNSVTGAAPGDRITISASGCVGLLGQRSLTNESFISQDAGLSCADVASRNDIFLASEKAPVKTSAFTFTGGTLDLINAVLRTAQMLIDDIDNKRTTVQPSPLFGFVFNAGTGNKNFVFSDAATVGSFKYQTLEYVSSVQNSFNEVNVFPQGLATQTDVSGLPPYNTLTYNTFNQTVSDALSLAKFIIATQNLVQVTPYKIATNTMLAPSCTDIAVLSTTDQFTVSPFVKSMNLGSAATVEFRGTTVEARIQGINTNFYPDYASVQLYLSPSLGTPFLLNNNTFGVLDQNKLGYP